VTYVYDGNRMRTKKSGGTLYWRDVTGTTIAETTLGGADVNEYVFFAGRRVARIGSAGGVYYENTGTDGTFTVFLERPPNLQRHRPLCESQTNYGRIAQAKPSGSPPTSMWAVTSNVFRSRTAT